MHPRDAPPGKRRRGRPPKRRLMGRIPYDRSESHQATDTDTDDDTRILLLRKNTRDASMGAVQEDEIDEAGEEKIDKDGELKGGREYKAVTFTIPSRGDTLLMFASEPARLFSYRDSSQLFEKNPGLQRVDLDESETDWLVKRRLAKRFPNRKIAVVTARSIFRCFGSKIIRGGRRCRDDYFEARAREEGFTDEDPGADSEDIDGRRSLLSRSGHALVSPVNSATWIHHAALDVRGFNSRLRERRSNAPVFYDIHTNVNQVATTTQPTHCKFEASDVLGPATDIHFETHTHTLKRLRTGLGHDLLTDTHYEEERDYLSAKAGTPVDTATGLSTEVSMGNQGSDDAQKYPLALIQGQFQALFPLEPIRFNVPPPKLRSPSAQQAEMAKNHYLSQIPMSQVNHHQGMPQQLIQHPSPPLPHHLGAMMAATSPRVSSPVRREPATCGFVSSAGQVCHKAVVSGGRCQFHQVKPVQPSTVDNKCTDCHELSVPKQRISKDELPVCDPYTMIKCAKCSHKYHPLCAELKTPRPVAAVESYPWSCPNCKTCCVCKSAGNEETLLICDGCDRGWHMECCKPKILDFPEGTWLCAFCADCHSCDEQGTDGDYYHAIAPPSELYDYPVYLATYCGRCFDNFEEDRFCPVCLKTYSETDDNDDEDNEMVACDQCDHWVHTKCDETLTPQNYQKLCDDEGAKYSCPMCTGNIKPIVHTANASIALEGDSAPIGYCVGLLGGKIKTRGVATYKTIKVGVPEINGTGMAEMPRL